MSGSKAPTLPHLVSGSKALAPRRCHRHATESQHRSGGQSNQCAGTLHHGAFEIGSASGTTRAELPTGAPSPLCHGGLGHLASHLDVPAAPAGNRFSCFQPRHALIARADSTADWYHLFGRGIGTIPRPLGPGSCRCCSPKGARAAGTRRHAHLDGIQAAAAHGGEQGGLGEVHDSLHGDSLRVARPHT